jgi:hypothetical protein
MAAGFTPVCLAIRRELRDGQARELFYVLLMRPNSGIVNLLDLPFPGHRAPPENALKSGVSILLLSFFRPNFAQVDHASRPSVNIGLI